MAEPIAPYYVSFHTDRVPATVDQSRASPGPSGSGHDRAGHTSVRSRARVTFSWDHGPERADHTVPFFARSINVFFRLDDFVVAISSDFPAGSCAYEATRRHEFESHIAGPMRIFHSHRDLLIRRLNAVPMPTERAPTWILPQAIPGLRQTLQQRVIQAVGAVKQELLRALEADRRVQDSSAAYRLVYQQCSADEWARGR